MNHWLMKTEPTTFSIDDLAAMPDRTTGWDGVRNYQARNFMRDGMQLGDLVLLYHSSCAIPGVVGIMEVVREAHPDPTALDPEDPHFDPKSDPDAPRWLMVDVRLTRSLARIIPLDELRTTPELAQMQLLRRGNRLSVMPVTEAEYACILRLV
jgi:predicted RNA-binding protein with PUA-like domain